MNPDALVTDSTGNVFRDMGLADADERLAKAELSRILTRVIRDRGLTQRAAANVLGVAPSDVSDLVRGKLARFSYERLIRFLLRMRLNVSIRVSTSNAGRPAAVRVESAASL